MNGHLDHHDDDNNYKCNRHNICCYRVQNHLHCRHHLESGPDARLSYSATTHSPQGAAAPSWSTIIK